VVDVPLVVQHQRVVAVAPVIADARILINDEYVWLTVVKPIALVATVFPVRARERASAMNIGSMSRAGRGRQVG